MHLTSVSDVVQMVTSAAGSVSAHVSYSDISAGTVSPLRKFNASVNTATTTGISDTVPSSTTRKIKLIIIRNTHASISNDITLQVYDGTTTNSLWKGTLAAGECVWFVEDSPPVVYLASGSPKVPDNLNFSGVQTFSMGSVALIATPIVGGKEYDGNNFYATPVTNERGVTQQEAWITLQSGTRTLASQTGAQKMFASPTGGALTIASGRMYEFECLFALASMSASSGSFGWALTGTATFNEIKWMSWAAKLATIATGTTAATLLSTYNTTAANVALVTANTAVAGFAYIVGSFISNAGGTIIPSISLGVAATAVLSQGALFKIRAFGNSAASAGNWS